MNFKTLANKIKLKHAKNVHLITYGNTDARGRKDLVSFNKGLAWVLMIIGVELE